MAVEVRRQFRLDCPRVNVSVDGHGEVAASQLWDTLFASTSPVTAWRMADALTQGTLAEWYEAAVDTFARGATEHLVDHERQRIELDFERQVVRIEKEFRKLVLDSNGASWGTPMRLYLEIDCGGRRRVRSTWQQECDDGVLVCPHS
jgi:hypothetical protein